MGAAKKYSLILSGGGARGAYEVGVLKFLFQELPKKYGFTPDFRIICGTSVGAIHACFIASHINDIISKINRLESIWTELKPQDVVSFDFGQILSLKNLLWGGRRGAGLLDVTPLKLLLTREANWGNIQTALNSSCLDALCISSTSTRTGRTAIFTQTNQLLPEPGFRSHFAKVTMGIDHAMASASLPILFPPVFLNGEWFTDGGIRHNTPISPAVAFDSTHVFSVGLWRDDKSASWFPQYNAPGIGSLIGKIFNSFFIDNAEYDTYNLDIINSLIKEASKFSGKDFERHLSNTKNQYRYITSCTVNPSADIGRITAEYLSNNLLNKNRFYRTLMKLIDVNTFEADLASYLLFDGDFAKILIQLGFEDAQAHERQILDFFEINKNT